MDLKLKVIKLNLKKVEEEGSSQFGPSKDWPGGQQTRAAAAPTLWNSKTEILAVGQAHGCSKRLLHVREARPGFCHAGSENGILVEIARVRHMDCRGGPRVLYGTEPTNKLYSYTRTVSVCMFGVHLRRRDRRRCRRRRRRRPRRFRRERRCFAA